MLSVLVDLEKLECLLSLSHDRVLAEAISMICSTHFLVSTQAQQHHVATYVSGFVVGTAPLCIAVMSPLIGYFVSTTAVVSYVLWLSELHPKIHTLTKMIALS